MMGEKNKKTLLCMTAEIDAVCRKYDIKEVLVGGSLLGAIRHGGFIPWDDKLERYILFINLTKRLIIQLLLLGKR